MITHDGKEVEIVNIIFGIQNYAELYYKHNNAYNYANVESLKGEELERVINTFRKKEKMKVDTMTNILTIFKAVVCQMSGDIVVADNCRHCEYVKLMGDACVVCTYVKRIEKCRLCGHRL